MTLTPLIHNFGLTVQNRLTRSAIKPKPKVGVLLSPDSSYRFVLKLAFSGLKELLGDI